MIFLLLMLLPNDGQSIQKVRSRIISFTEHPDLTYAHDMVAVGAFVYIIENRHGRLLKAQMEHGQIGAWQELARQGEGPGELFLPVQVVADSQHILIKDERGFSVFVGERFEHRFRSFTPHINFCSRGKKVFFLTGNIQSPFLIDVFDLSGRKITSVLEKFLPESRERFSFRIGNIRETFHYRGEVLSDEESIYYLNASFGKFIKMNHQGKVSLDKNVLEAFGPYGELIEAQNRDLMNAQWDQIQQFEIYELFHRAFLEGDHLYLYAKMNYHQKLGLEQTADKFVFIFDKTKMTRSGTLRLQLDSGQEVQAVTVANVEDRPGLLALLDTAQGIQLHHYSLEWKQ